MNSPALSVSRFQMSRLCHHTFSRRSHKDHILWERMRRLIDHWSSPTLFCPPFSVRQQGVLT